MLILVVVGPVVTRLVAHRGNHEDGASFTARFPQATVGYTTEACGWLIVALDQIHRKLRPKRSGAIDPAWLPGVRAVNGPGTFIERVIDRATPDFPTFLDRKFAIEREIPAAEVERQRPDVSSQHASSRRSIEGQTPIRVRPPSVRSSGAMRTSA